MIVKANSVVSGVTPNKPPAPGLPGADFSATLEQAFPTQPTKAALPVQQVKAPRPATSTAEEMGSNAEPAEVLPVELPPVEIVTDLPLPVEQHTDGTPFVDPQLVALQQMVAQNAQAAVAPVQQAPATAQPVEAAQDPGSDALAKPLTDAATPPPTQRQNTAFVLPESMKPKAVAQAAQNVMPGKQGTDKVASEQHDAFLSGVNRTDNQKEAAAVQTSFRPEINRMVPVAQESASMLIPENGMRVHQPAVSELASVATPAATSPAALNQALGTPAWQQALSQQLAYFTRNGIHDAQLRLHPQELGSLQINLRLNNDQAQLHFVTENHQVRAALEAAMPHLRTSLAESGINLGQSSVSADSSSSWGTSAQNGGRSNQSHAEDESQDNPPLADENSPISTKTIHYANGINTFV